MPAAPAAPADWVVLRGPRRPNWGCGCGFAGNWASRLKCLECERPAPARIANAARRAHQAATQGDPAQPKPRAKAKAKAKASAAQAKAKAKAEPKQKPTPVTPALSFAEVLARSFPQLVAAGPANELEIEEAEEAEDEDDDWEMDQEEAEEAEEPPEEASAQELRYWRERRALATRAGTCAAADAEACGQRIA